MSDVLATRRVKGLAKHHAAIVFKQVIIPALYTVENGDSQIRVIQDTFETHYQTAITFSTYLKGAELESFNMALDHYKQWQSAMCGRYTSEIMYNAEDPKYLNAKVINPIDLLKKLSMHANT